MNDFESANEAPLPPELGLPGMQGGGMPGGLVPANMPGQIKFLRVVPRPTRNCDYKIEVTYPVERNGRLFMVTIVQVVESECCRGPLQETWFHCAACGRRTGKCCGSRCRRCGMRAMRQCLTQSEKDGLVCGKCR